MPRVGLVTCKVLPEPDPDADLLVEALGARGLDAEWIAWDDPSHDVASMDLAVLRSTWNYYEDLPGFLAWIERAARVTRLENGAEIVRWNVHKSYLETIARAGIPVVPTRLVRASDPASVDVARARWEDVPWEDVVVKPAVSASSFGTRRFTADPGAAREFAAAFLARGADVIVQPFQPEFADPGERALVWIDGEATHAVVKRPRFDGEEEEVSDAEPPTAAERGLVDRALALVPGTPLYARVDVIPTANGERLVSELEIVEPSLFLLQHPPALERFVESIERRVKT